MGKKMAIAPLKTVGRMQMMPPGAKNL